MTVERSAFVVRLLCYLAFGTFLVVCNLVFDYARIRTVVEDRHSAIGAFVAGARFVRRHPATLRLYLINGAGFILLALVYALVAPGAPSGLAIWIALALGQLYILLRHYVKLLFYASQVAYFQGSLAHAAYTAAPPVVWPESPAAESIGNPWLLSSAPDPLSCSVSCYIPSVNDIVRLAAAAGDSGDARGFVVGLSGGIDSAVVARLCQLATPGQVAGVIMPCRSDPRDEADAGLVADAFSIPDDSGRSRTGVRCAARRHARGARRADAGDAAGRSTTATDGWRLGTCGRGCGWPRSYFVANSLNYLVAGTGNRSELTIGYFTKHGDGGVDVLPIGHLLKSQVRALAKELGVPQAIIDKAPSAGLWLGQTDEDEMGFSYADLERYLTDGPEGVSPALALRLERMIRATEHKRGLPPTPEL